MRPFFALCVFGRKEIDRFFYGVKIKNRLTAVKIDIIILCQPGQKKTSALSAVAASI